LGFRVTKIPYYVGWENFSEERHEGKADTGGRNKLSEKKILPGANIFSDEFKKTEEERWNLKADPYTASRRCLEEAKKKPQPLRGTGMLALMVLEWASRGSEGSLSEPESSHSEEHCLIREEQGVVAVKTIKTQSGSPRPVWRFGGFLLGRPSPVPEKTSESTSKKPAGSSETYVEAYDGSGRGYLKRVVVEG